jgi:hypothetical protein
MQIHCGRIFHFRKSHGKVQLFSLVTNHEVMRLHEYKYIIYIGVHKYWTPGSPCN